MKHRILVAVVLASVLITVGCTPPEKNARNAAAAIKGYVVTAEQQCATNPAKAFCKDIPNAKSAQNALITAIESYCGWTPATAQSNPNAVCKPDKSLQSQLVSATNNVNQFVTEFKGAL